MITVRPEGPEDITEVRRINIKAFDQTAEADIVDSIRQDCPDALSLIAEIEGRIVGHIFFAPALIGNGDKVIGGMGLAPMAVLPEYQRKGIGTKLVDHGLRILRNRSCPFVIVLGHPDYYPRFGFEVVSKYRITCQWDGVPDEAFMVIILDKDAMKNVSGVARYRNEFNEVM